MLTDKDKPSRSYTDNLTHQKGFAEANPFSYDQSDNKTREENKRC